MEKIDCLFIHTPRSFCLDYSNIWFVPIGVFGLADLLNKNNFRTQILHLGIEKLIKDSFDITSYIKTLKVKIICVDIHWHYQLYRTLQLIKKIKKEIPEIKIIVGGFTASLFAKELLRSFPEIDFVIKGDAEIPLLKLVKSLSREQYKSDFSQIPNLYFRRNRTIIEAGRRYVINQRLFDNLRFSNLTLLKNYKIYLKLNPFISSQSFSEMMRSKENTFSYVFSRGCLYNCSYCGGSRETQVIINSGRDRGMILKSQIRVIEDLKRLKSFGVSTLYFSLTPTRFDYFIGLFKKIRENKLNFRAIVEIFCSLPPKQLINEFFLTFKSSSLIFLGIPSFSEKIRKLNLGPYYSNKKLVDTLDYLEKKGNDFCLQLSLGTGLPFETPDDFNFTVKFLRFLKNRYKNISMGYWVNRQADPKSPCLLHPSRYKIKLIRKSFTDFYKLSKLKDSHQIGIGHSTNLFTSEEIIANFKKLNRLITPRYL